MTFKLYKKDILHSISSNTTTPVYFYLPQQHAKTYIQIHSTRVSQHPETGENIAEVEVKINVQSESKSSKDCIDVLDTILELHNSGKIHFSKFAILQTGEMDRTITIANDNRWLGEMSLYFWLETTN